MAVLLTVVVTVLSGIAYRRLEQALVHDGTTRITVASQRLAEMLDQSARRMGSDVARTARDTLVREYMGGRGALAEARLRRAFDRARGSSSRTLGIELRSRQGEALLSVGTIPPADPARVPRANVSNDTTSPARIGPIRAVADTIFLEIDTPVLAIDGDTLGSLVVYSRLSSRSDMQGIAEFIGPEAVLLLGNASGGVWTDFSTGVSDPPSDVVPASVVSYPAPDGEERLGVATPVPGTPWLAMVAMPRRVILGPAHQFLGEMAGFAVLAIGLGALVGWVISREMTQPIADMVVVAEGMTAGDYSRRVVRRRGDEFGRLATSFNTMAQKVEDGTRTLEAAVVDRTRELEQVLVALRDAQDAVVRRERLAVLGQLAGGVGHELRNPLGVMTNALYYLDAVLDDAQPVVREYLGILRTQVGLSEKIVGDLLDYARIRPPSAEPTSLAALAAEQLERLGPTTGITVDREFASSLPPAFVDRAQLGQVVLNVIANAVQAMPDGGTLTLRGSSGGNGRVILDVIDTGVGIAPEHFGKLFEPLFTTKARGIGLGLAVSRSLVQANHGEITVQSRLGVGTTFSVIVPTAPATAV